MSQCDRAPEELFSSWKYDSLKDVLAFNVDKFLEIRNLFSGMALQRITDKAREGKRVKLAFVAYSASQWSCHYLYDAFTRDPRFDVFAVVCGYLQIDEDARELTRKREKALLEAQGVRCFDYDEAVMRYGEGGTLADIIFYLTPYTLTPSQANIEVQGLRSLIAIIPYGMFVESQEWGNGKKKYDFYPYQCAWRYFCDTAGYKQMLHDDALCGDTNVEFLGYPKMDELIEVVAGGCEPSADLWKIPPDAKSPKRVVYAPHHSVDYDEDRAFSTFAFNCHEMLDLARRTQNEVSWVFQPHPLLKQKCISAGVFSCESDYDLYVDEWDALPNARVAEGSTRETNALFASSDALVLDSISFLAEYMYTGKPQVLLTRTSQKFCCVGEGLRDCLYLVDGKSGTFQEDLLSIIEEVLVQKNDYKKEKRQEYFELNLDYRAKNGGVSASEAIYRHVLACLGV